MRALPMIIFSTGALVTDPAHLYNYSLSYRHFVVFSQAFDIWIDLISTAQVKDQYMVFRWMYQFL